MANPPAPPVQPSDETYNLIGMLGDDGAPAFTSEQVPDGPALMGAASDAASAFNGMNLPAAGQIFQTDPAPLSPDEMTRAQLIANMSVQCPEIAQYLQQPPAMFNNINELDKSLFKAKGVAQGLKDDLGGAVLVVAADLTESSDRVLGTGERMKSSPNTPMEVATRVDKELFPPAVNIQTAAQQQQDRRQRDAHRAKLQTQQIAQQQAALDTAAKLSSLRQGALPAAAATPPSKATKKNSTVH